MYNNYSQDVWLRARSSSDSVLTTGSISERINNLQQQATEPHQTSVGVTLQRNKSSLHAASQSALGGSMTSLSSAPTPRVPSPASSLSTSDLSDRPRSHGKPNLAPKPPGPAPDRPSPPPKKLIVNGKMASRTQSMRVPRSPPVSPPSPPSPGGRPAHLPPAPALPPVGTKNPASHFGTLRAPRVLRPPGVSPPPPPPPARHASLAHPPPPPPHHRQNSSGGDDPPAPAPPVRGSSMRAADLEARFAEMFHPATRFPPPDPFLRIDKGYSSATLAGNKAPAPPPPLRAGC
ncbi:uncharacterized protein LOC101747115 isoform X2 [Bombyx mori]|uniref:Uncharacterized protein n=1 Tax=Bombyx mori TaxID=7091 RepID=A0A8R2QTG7_BOMMO|nr:formin-like protein 20 isoform X2 [Bombyx mori]